MAANIRQRLVLQGSLVATTPIHVGGFGDDVDTDLPLARNGQGQWYIPGTSLAGALRQWCYRLMGDRATRQAWGFQQAEHGCASFITVEDAIVENAGQLVNEIRDHVGIDRQWGCAAAGIKFDRAILPRGTRLPFRLAVQVVEASDRSSHDWLTAIEVACPELPELDRGNSLTPALAIVALLKQALENEHIRIGAAKTRGLGRVKLEHGKILLEDWATKDGILTVVESNAGREVSPTVRVVPLSGPGHYVPLSSLAITVKWHPVGPIMVKSGYDGVAADMLPLVSYIDGKVALVLPGSSIKGAMRAHAERIVRTVLDTHALTRCTYKEDDRRRFLDALDVPLVNELFGRRGERTQSSPTHAQSYNEEDEAQNTHGVDGNRGEWLPGLGALAVDDCFGCDSCKVEQWQAIEAAENDVELRKVLQQANLDKWCEAYHVAIDRWLGSAAESMLYTVLEPHDTRWEPIRLSVDLARLPDDRRLAAVALLLFVLQDFVNDRVPLGFATHRGMGSTFVTELEMHAQGAPEPLAALDGMTFRRPPQIGTWRLLNDIPATVRDELNQAWQRWLSQMKHSSQPTPGNISGVATVVRFGATRSSN